MLPLRIRRYRHCPRCGLTTPIKKTQCRYCSGLDDRGVDQLRERHARQLARNRKIGIRLGGACLVLLLVLLMLMVAA